MVTLQDVIILRISDFRRYFTFYEFWQKKDEFVKLFKNENHVSIDGIEPYLFTDNKLESVLVRRLADWLPNTQAAINNVKLTENEIKIDDFSGNIITCSLGRLKPYIEKAKKDNLLTGKEIIGLTLLYLLLGADEGSSTIPIVYANGHTDKSENLKFDRMNTIWDDLTLERTNDTDHGFHQCIFVNKNCNKKITITFNKKKYPLHYNECIVGIFVGNKCYDLLPNITVDNELGITMKLSVNSSDQFIEPRCEIHRPNTNIVYLPGVVSFMIDRNGADLYLDLKGKLHYEKCTFSTKLRVQTFLESKHDDEVIGFKIDNFNNLIFITKDRIYH